MKTYDISQLVDERNQSLYKAITEQVALEIVPSSTEYWGERTHEGRVVIFCAESRYPQACFAHELLHVRLNLRGLTVQKVHLEATTQDEYDRLDKAVDSLLHHARNQLHHYRMWPDFLEMGYDHQQFFSKVDGRETERVHREDIPYLEKVRKTAGRRLTPHSIVFPYLFLKNPHVESEQTSATLKRLRSICDGRFYDLERLVANWSREEWPCICRYLAHLFYLCDMPSVGFETATGSVVWARDCRSLV